MSFLLNTVNKVNDTFAKAGSFNSEFGMMTGMTPIDILSCNFERSKLHDRISIGVIPVIIPNSELKLPAFAKVSFTLFTVFRRKLILNYLLLILFI